MKKILFLSKPIAFMLIFSIILASCASTTRFQTVPTDAKIYLNEEFVGTTPHTHTDTKIVGTTTLVRLEKEGYAPLYTTISRNEEADVGAIIGGFLFLAPFLWTMKYKATHTYELMPYNAEEQIFEMQEPKNDTFLKVDQLREFKTTFRRKSTNRRRIQHRKKENIRIIIFN